MNSEIAPTLNEWQDLYQKARLFQVLRPWEWFSDDILIAVEEPVTKDVAYCSIMGAGGMEYGVVAYRGTAGLLSFVLVANDALDEDEMLLVQDCLSFSLGDREMIYPEDREVHKALGLRFRGRGAWPIFRGHRPGYFPAIPTGQEARFLSTCLGEICGLVEEIRSGRPLPEVTTDSRILARCRDDAGNWRTTSLPFPPAPPSPSLEVNELPLQRLRRELSPVAQTWQIRVQIVAPIVEGDLSYWAWLLLCVEEKSGLVIMADMGGPDDTPQSQFLKILEQAGALPKELKMTSSYLESQLGPLTEVLGVKIRQVKRLPELDRAAKFFKASFGAL